MEKGPTHEHCVMKTWFISSLVSLGRDVRMSPEISAVKKSVRTYLEMISFETGSYNITPASLIFIIPVPQPSERRVLRDVPLHSAYVISF